MELYDTTGVRQLFEQYYTPLVLFAVSYVNEREIAKDLVQDVFFSLIENRQQFESIDNLKFYLYSAVRNRCLKHLRHETVKNRYENYILQKDKEKQHYEEHLLEEEVFLLLNQAIEELPEQCRKVFNLSLQGKSNAEIAEIMNVSIETVKSHKKTGKKILYGKLKDTVSVVTITFYFTLLNL